VLAVGPWLLARASSSVLLCVAAAGAGVRWLCSRSPPAPWGWLPLQSMHGLSFGLWLLSLVSFVQSGAPRELRTSLQSAAYSCLGLGTIAGYLAGGYLFARHGGSVLFQLAAGASGAALLCYLGTSLLPARTERDRRRRPRAWPRSRGRDGSGLNPPTGAAGASTRELGVRPTSSSSTQSRMHSLEQWPWHGSTWMVTVARASCA